MRGLLAIWRRPLAKISPNKEFCSNCFKISPEGTALRETAMASSTSLGGTIFSTRKAMKRSMMKATAKMEHTIMG